MARLPNPPLYELEHGIIVTGEYAHGRYVMCKVKPHPLFNAKIHLGTMYIRRSRVILTAKLGRVLLPSEHVHHRNHDRHDDRPENLEILSAAAHNKEHKLGTRHSSETKRRIGTSLRAAYREGRKKFAPVEQRGEANPAAKLTHAEVGEIRNSTAKVSVLADRYGVSPRNIRFIRNGDTW